VPQAFSENALQKMIAKWSSYCYKVKDGTSAHAKFRSVLLNAAGDAWNISRG
jgi:hypothetical protein